MSIRARIETVLREKVAALGFPDVTITLTHPDVLSHGDFATSVALALSKQAGKPPRAVAEDIVRDLEIDGVARIEIAGPGFINFTLDTAFFAGSLNEILNTKTWGSTDTSHDTVLLEHSSPNLFKPFHIGHLVNNAIGESLVRLIESQGNTVIRLSYPSDISPGIAKAVWALKPLLSETDELTVDHFGKAYAAGTLAYESDSAAKADIDAITKELYQKVPGVHYKVYQHGVAESKRYFIEQTKRLGSDFKEFIFESESEEAGKKIVKEFTPSVFELSDGAYIYRGSKDGLFDNVFVNSAGFATYLGKDVGLLDIKFSRYGNTGFTRSITVTDIEQKPHFLLLKAAVKHINPAWAEKSEFVHHGRLQFVGGKVSSRYGNVPLLEDLFSQVQDKIHAKVAERLTENSKAFHETLEAISVAALKYSILRAAPGTNIVYDFERATSTEGDSGPYLQYTHARATSILAKARGQGIEPTATTQQVVTELERTLYRFPDVVARAAENLEPHHVAHFLTHIAGLFNSWYAQVQVLDGSDAVPHKLAVVAAVQKTLAQGLHYLGIKAPEQM